MNRRWLDGRDLFFGHPARGKQDIPRALEIAVECQDEVEEAKWLVYVATHVKPNYSTWREAFLSLDTLLDGGRTLCYAAIISPWTDLDLLIKAARMGYPYAQSQVFNCIKLGYQERRDLLLLSVRANDRDALNYYGWEFRFNVGTEQHIKQSAELGCHHAFYNHGLYNFTEYDLDRYVWFWRAYKAGCTKTQILTRMCETITCLRTRDECSEQYNLESVVYTIGSLVRDEKDLIKFSVDLDFAVYFFKQKRELVRRNIHAWTAIAHFKLGVVKDIRRLISNMVWEDGLQHCHHDRDEKVKKKIKI